MVDVFKIRGDRPARRIQDALFKAMDRRKKIGEKSYDWDGQQYYEFMAVFDAVSREMIKLGKGGVDPGQVRRARKMAEGHVDYVAKWPLYCEEIVRGVF